MLKTSFSKFICLLFAAFSLVVFLKAQNIDKPVLLSGGAAKKRASFRLIYDREEALLKSLLNAGMKLPNSKN